MKTTCIIGLIGGGGSLRYAHEVQHVQTPKHPDGAKLYNQRTGRVEGMVIGFTNGAQSN
jgi:hypothetical protein